MIYCSHKFYYFINMSLNNNTSKSRAYAMEYGTFLGLSWSIIFLLYTTSIINNNFLLMLLSSIMHISLPLFSFYLSWRYSTKIIIQNLSWLQSWSFAFMMYVYASLLTGAVEFIYFKYFDNGALFYSIKSMAYDNDMFEIYKNAGMENYVITLRESVDAILQISTIDLTLSLFNQNIFTGMILSIPCMIIIKKLHKQNVNNNLN